MPVPARVLRGGGTVVRVSEVVHENASRSCFWFCAGIDPDAVFFERPGVIALRDNNAQSDTGQVVVYLDPVTLRETETLSKVELRTPDNGVTNRIGVFNVTISLNGELEDIEAWATRIDTAAVLAVIDSQ